MGAGLWKLLIQKKSSWGICPLPMPGYSGGVTRLRPDIVFSCNKYLTLIYSLYYKLEIVVNTPLAFRILELDSTGIIKHSYHT